MTNNQQRCGGSGQIHHGSEDGWFANATCPGCEDCKPKCFDPECKGNGEVFGGFPCADQEFHKPKKCGTCGGSGSVWDTRVDDDSGRQPCPDCTPKPPDSGKIVHRAPPCCYNYGDHIWCGDGCPCEECGPHEKPPASSEEAHGDCGSRRCACYRRGARDALLKISSLAERMRL